MSEDPIGFSGGDYNLYRYCGNSPTNGTDPSGNIAPLLVVAGFAIAGLSTANVAYRVETAQYNAGFEAAAKNDWNEFYNRYENGQYAQAVGNIGVTVAATAPLAFFGGAAIGIGGRAATNLGGGYLTAYHVGMAGMGVAGLGATGYHAFNLAQATGNMSGPERLNAWGCFGSSLAVGLPLGVAGFRGGPGMAMAAMESRLGIASMRIMGANRAAGLIAALGPLDDMAASGVVASLTPRLYSYHYGATRSGAFTSSSGRVYMTSYAPGNWLTNKGMLANFTRFVRTGGWSPYPNQNQYFVTQAGVHPSAYGLKPIPIHVTNFWKRFGGQYHTGIGTSGFERLGTSNVITTTPVASSSLQTLQASAGRGVELAGDATALTGLASGGYLVYANWRR